MFTRLGLLTRPCCGNRCRHCPYGHFGVLDRPRLNLPTSSCLLVPGKAAGRLGERGVAVVEVAGGCTAGQVARSVQELRGRGGGEVVMVHCLSQLDGLARGERLQRLGWVMDVSHQQGVPLAVVVDAGSGVAGGAAGGGRVVVEWRVAGEGASRRLELEAPLQALM